MATLIHPASWIAYLPINGVVQLISASKCLGSRTQVPPANRACLNRTRNAWVEPFSDMEATSQAEDAPSKSPKAASDHHFTPRITVSGKRPRGPVKPEAYASPSGDGPSARLTSSIASQAQLHT